MADIVLGSGAAASDFWSNVQASGLTAEEELVELWQRLRAYAPTQLPNVLLGGGAHYRPGQPSQPSRPGLLRQAIEEDEIILALLPAALVALESP